MPSFNGTAIFGAQISMSLVETGRETQENTYFGIDGTETLDAGFRHHRTVVRGRLYGFKAAGGLSDLISAIILFRSYIDGNAYTLVDNLGLTWQNVKLESFTLDAQTGIMQSGDQWFQSYVAMFKHLSVQ